MYVDLSTQRSVFFHGIHQETKAGSSSSSSSLRQRRPFNRTEEHRRFELHGVCTQGPYSKTPRKKDDIVWNNYKHGKYNMCPPCTCRGTSNTFHCVQLQTVTCNDQPVRSSDMVTCYSFICCHILPIYLLSYTSLRCYLYILVIHGLMYACTQRGKRAKQKVQVTNRANGTCGALSPPLLLRNQRRKGRRVSFPIFSPERGRISASSRCSGGGKRWGSWSSSPGM